MPESKLPTFPTSYSLGRLNFQLIGDPTYAPHIISELQSLLRKNQGNQSHITYDFLNYTELTGDYISVSPIRVKSNEYQSFQAGSEHVVRFNSDTINVQVRTPEKPLRQRLQPPAIQRIWNWNFLTRDEEYAKNFMYDVFDYTTQTKQLELGQTYIHASTMTKGRLALALLASGGIGKTSSLLKFILEDNWQYLSDDLGLIDDDGVLRRTPKKLQIYGYNVRGQETIKQALLARRSLTDRAAWFSRLNYAGERRVRRRTSAEEVFTSEKIAGAAPITHAFFLERRGVEQFLLEPMSVDELSDCAAQILMQEIQPFGEISAAVYGTSIHSNLPSANQVFRKTREVISLGFKNVSPQRIGIPLSASPDELFHFIKAQI